MRQVAENSPSPLHMAVVARSLAGATLSRASRKEWKPSRIQSRAAMLLRVRAKKRLPASHAAFKVPCVEAEFMTAPLP